MDLKHLVNVSNTVSRTRSRLKKTAALGDCLRAADADEVALIVNYLSGVMPQGRIGLGPAMVDAALRETDSGADVLALADVDRRLDDIARQSGSGSKARKQQLFGELLSRVSADEQAFLVNLVLGELRQGALEGVLIEGIAAGSGVPVERIRRAVMLAADPAAVAGTVFGEGVAGLDRFRLTPLKAVRPMLAQPADSVDQAIEGLGAAALQYKLDGARIQVHRVDDEVRIFTRQLHEVSGRLPEIVEDVLRWPVRDCILDGEVIALNADGRPLPFQVTMRRFGRSRNVAEMRDKLPLTGAYFDCLYFDGAELIDRPLSARLDLLGQIAEPAALVPQMISDDPGAAGRFLTQALEHGHEGLMAKALDSPYAAGNRGADWLKIKQAHTFDLVVLAAEWGSGRRKGWLSNLHLGARGADNSFVMLGKTFKGLTDKTLAWQTRELLAREIGREGSTVHVRPELVAEIAVNDIQVSPQYPAGLALRFARLKRYRTDKTAAEADTIDAVRALLQPGGE